MGVVVVLVHGRPKEGPHDTAALDGTEREVPGSDHLLICLVGK